VLVIAVLSTIGLAHLAVSSYVHPYRMAITETPADDGLPYTDATLLTRDGIKLAAWYIPGPGTRSDGIVLVHGIGANRQGLLPLAGALHARGYHVLLFDLRAHGASAGDTSTLGVRETLDVDVAVKYLQMQPGVDPARIGVYGQSLGAATVLMAAAADDDIHAVVSESPFASARWLVGNQLSTLPCCRTGSDHCC
jgi:uncharacterized protein